MRFELRLLQYAQALAEHGSFSRAAKALDIAQPSLSRGIIELESRVGVPLFHRSRSGNELTDFGRVFLQHAEQVLRSAQELEREVDQARGLTAAEVSAALGPYVVDAIGAQAAGLFSVSNPDIRLLLTMTDPASVARAVRTRTADLGIAEDSVIADADDFETLMTLAPLRAWILVRAGHPLAQRRDITIADVLDFPFAQVVMLPPRILKPVLAARRQSADGAAPPFPALECATARMAIGAVMASDAFTFGSLGQVRAELESGTILPLLQPPWLRSSWSIVRLRKRPMTPAMRALVAALHRAHEAALREDQMLNDRIATTAGRRDIGRRGSREVT
ncbi:MAG: LysR family transcriptional regulator [Gammaproteobacteria bacterium]